MSHVHRKEIEYVQNTLQNYRCPTCSLLSNEIINSVPDGAPADDSIKFSPIGVIRTSFPEKRCLPRQAVLGSSFLSRMEFVPSIFTNPEHSLDGLIEFSHIWIIYHFHKNNSHAKAKVAPPRLEGQRIGVFATRSPHRPCPIGLSLVELDGIRDGCIFFKGTDMVDGTPVLDIKPYIPHYDNPELVNEPNLNAGVSEDRSEPDGEENITETSKTTKKHSSPTIKVPDWIQSGTPLNVILSENAVQQSHELNVNVQALKNVLKSDPRSVYLRTRYGSDIYTFQLGENTVSVKFDDSQAKALVLQIRKTVRTEDLGDVQ